jgi:thiol-disulfide isomerase/thioredoxin
MTNLASTFHARMSPTKLCSVAKPCSVGELGSSANRGFLAQVAPIALACASLLACNSSDDGTNAGNGGMEAGGGSDAGGATATGGTLDVGGMGGTAPTGPPTTAQSLSQQSEQWGWGADQCPATPAGVNLGYATGDQLDSLVLKDCEDNDVSLDAVCGADVTWMFFAHGWCPHCKLASSLMEEIDEEYAQHNMAVVNIVVESASGGPPTADTCQAWRDTYGQEDVLTLYDPTGASFVLWEQNYTALSVFLDGNRVIDSKLHSDSEVTLKSTLNSLLP